MKTKSLLKAWMLASAMAALPVTAALPGAAVAQPAKPTGYKAPRTTFGTPDLQGVWTNVTLTPLERPASYGDRKVLTEQEVAQLEGRAVENVKYENAPTDPKLGAEDHTRKNCQGAGGRDCGYNAGWKDETTKVMRVGGEPRTSFITSTANGRLPPRVASSNNAAQRAIDRREAQLAEGEGGGSRPGQNDNPETRSLAERCIAFGNSIGPMLPNGYYNNNIRIVQEKDNVAILLEMVHDVRMVRIGGKHDNIKRYFGESIGRWEGDTLVVETKNYAPGASFRGSSANLEMTERFTRVGKDRLLYQFTVKDPTVWTTPWSGEYEFYPTGGDLYEYACHEGNYGLEGILAGAREEDRQAAAAKPQASAGAGR